MARLLIADDQVPDSNLASDKEVRDHYIAVHQNDELAEEFAEGCVSLRRLILLLEDRAYKVDCANTPDAALDLAKRNTYDAIILDLGWWALKEKPYAVRMRLGYEIAEQLRAINSFTPILMFSSRFYEDDQLAQTAADNRLLPVYKSDDEECRKHMLVTIRWVLNQRTLTEHVRVENEHVRIEAKKFALRMYRLLSAVLIGSIALGGILAGVTLVYVLRNNSELTLASTLFGLISSFISGSIYVYVHKFRRDALA
jgi:hypothetical protein